MQAKRAGLFVNITNQFYSTIHSHQGILIDYQKYLEEISNTLTLSRAFAYVVQMNNDAMGFITALRNFGYETRYRQPIMIQDRYDVRRTDLNLLMAMDIWRCIEKLDTVIIGSNDLELIPLITRIKEQGVQTIIYSCNVDNELYNVADRVIEVESHIMSRKREVVASS